MCRQRIITITRVETTQYFKTIKTVKAPRAVVAPPPDLYDLLGPACRAAFFWTRVANEGFRDAGSTGAGPVSVGRRA
jgi:hypothetical protein